MVSENLSGVANMRSKVIIIGGGLSGALAAMQLAQVPGGPKF